MARFETAYTKYVKPWEGGYSNVAADKGGETYAGISRKFFPTWSGWEIIDQKPQPIKRNTFFPELEEKVTNFYRLAFWDKYNFSKIIDQNVANILFDWLVNSGGNAAGTIGKETFGVDEILNRDFGFRLPIDRVIDSATIQAINSVDSKRLYDTIKIEREKFYKQLVENDASQGIFLTGWLNRLNSFPTYVVGAGVSVLLILIIALVALLFY